LINGGTRRRGRAYSGWDVWSAMDRGLTVTSGDHGGKTNTVT